MRILMVGTLRLSPHIAPNVQKSWLLITFSNLLHHSWWCGSCRVQLQGPECTAESSELRRQGHALTYAHLPHGIAMSPGEPHAGRAGPRGDGLPTHRRRHRVLARPGQPCPHLCARIHKARPSLRGRKLALQHLRGDAQAQMGTGRTRTHISKAKIIQTLQRTLGCHAQALPQLTPFHPYVRHTSEWLGFIGVPKVMHTAWPCVASRHVMPSGQYAASARNAELRAMQRQHWKGSHLHPARSQMRGWMSF